MLVQITDAVPEVYLNMALFFQGLKNFAMTVLISRILVSIKHEADVVVEDFKMYSDVVCAPRDASGICRFFKTKWY
jgi:hypothetical protein